MSEQLSDYEGALEREYRGGFEAGVRSVLESIDYEAGRQAVWEFFESTRAFGQGRFDERVARVVVNAALGIEGGDEASHTNYNTGEPCNCDTESKGLLDPNDPARQG